MKAKDIQRARQKIGMSQGCYAALMGIPTGTLQNWEHGRASSDAAVQTLLTMVTRAPNAFCRLMHGKNLEEFKQEWRNKCKR